MAKDFPTDEVKRIGYSGLLVSLGICVGFYIFPYFFNTANMDILINTGINVGRLSIIKDLQFRSVGIVKDDFILVYPDSSSTFYFVIKRGN